MITAALWATTAIATVASIVWTSIRGVNQADAGQRSALRRRPATWLVVVAIAIVANQLLVSAYVARAWRGHSDRIAVHLPSGWFDVGRFGWFTDHLPLVPWSILRIPAALELPFVMLAYLVVCGWCGPEWYAAARRTRWLTSATYTITFCLIEHDLQNQYTRQDIVIRVVSGLATPMLIGLLESPRSQRLHLWPLLVSVAGLGVCVLALYDSALLYNSAHLPRAAGYCLVGIAVVALGRIVALRSDGQAGARVSALTTTAAWFVALFFAPALPIRYALSFGAPGAALVATTVLAVTAVARGWHAATVSTVAASLAMALFGAALVGGLLHGYPEQRLLAAALAGLAAAWSTCRLLDHRASRRT